MLTYKGSLCVQFWIRVKRLKISKTPFVNIFIYILYYYYYYYLYIIYIIFIYIFSKYIYK